MRIAWATDVHLDFLDATGVTRFARALAQSGGECVVLTGDIAEAGSLSPLLEQIASVIERPIYFVLGNHDFYHGSIERVRAEMTALSSASRWLRWLPAIGAIRLGPTTLLVGHDGWGDGRAGDYERSEIWLNDHLLIRELTGLSRDVLRARLEALGDEAAASLRAHTGATAMQGIQHCVVATHVPPFPEASWHEGAMSAPDWLPFFACQAMGDALLELAERHPSCTFTVLCGHTHSSGVAQIRGNLRVHTGGAEYGAPALAAVLDV
ncbi:metallophosphoesterase family protein [Sandaracinus amylolyticus]|uniref:metallophosphoesterase family protein n=1 Tax=Sandaracinus amylolyticus TaxID=927083 RepID=UPI001F1F3A95|nr:metallophosphoesterase [Sandaracinus amylolyticus]UJR82996.1 Hypothetical protein I5071_50610 [Sandaracinus amylolyticus]